ncbi:Protein containing transglutaminase-like domain, putative cysteine protease [Euzebya pacifica]|uniref:Protein containing transglutaminase-like domain, putative cysteine protease n=1 Tax=Euzebya pacifica TaxID=1608957 RepID=A0A346Y4B9_9ACTN|nr:transglutaminase family protein [Euzebya pacifica]AXV09316.1 Protein containing transglutaminase-like domain, putative cysteine protease [Euzebya pacifica]
MTFAVVHRTTYTYESEVSASYGEAHLLPRSMPGQRVQSAELTVTPTPGTLDERLDWFGNRTHFFELSSGHTRLSVTASSLVEVTRQPIGDQLLASQPWESVRDRLAGGPGGGDPASVLAATEFVIASEQAPSTAAAAAYALPSFRPGRPVLEAVEELSSRIHRDFEFHPGATTVGTPVDDVLRRRTGVCQDFAHLTIASLRALGLAARYVSGYLETDPPPGKPKLQGADVSHAWASVFVPDIGWVDIDPTNDQFVGDRYITTAWGRDYGDVAPLKGVIFTDGDTQRLEVSVDVRRVRPADTPPPGSALPGSALPGPAPQPMVQQQSQSGFDV